MLQQPSNFRTDEYYNPRKLRLTKIKTNEIFTAKIFHNMKKLCKILFLGGEGGNFSGGQFTWWAIFRGAIFLGGLFPGGNSPGSTFLGGIFPGGIFPSTDIFKLMCYLIFSPRLGGLKRLYGKISSQQSGIPAVQKRDPALPG